jgi:hypothetical protein
MQGKTMDTNRPTTIDPKVLSFPYGDSTIRFTPYYSSRRKTIEIAVEAPDQVIVTSPQGRTDEEIIKVVARKAKWITQQLYKMKDIRFQPVMREFVSGEALLYMGRNFRLDLQLDPTFRKPIVNLMKGIFSIQTKSAEQDYLRPFMIDWYKQKCSHKIQKRVDYYAGKLGVQPKEIHVKEQKKRWASCTLDNTLYFNWRCILAPAQTIDYIIVHELCHILEKSHSSRFWSLLRTVMPEYEARKKWLMDNGVKLDV